MGVQCTIVVYAPDEPAARHAAASAFAELARLELLFSDYRPDSELSALNHAAGQAPLPVHPDTLDILARARVLARDTHGAFDPTVGPLVALWRRARDTGALAPDHEHRQALARVGWRRLELDPAAGTARLLDPGMRLDLGGIAKGYAAQRAVQHLASLGHSRSMVALAGDSAVGDKPPGRPGWAVEIEPAGDAPGHTLLLRRTSVSTSGDAHQSLVIDGQRFSHIIDPRTGRGGSPGVTATVVAPDGATADALATALTILPSAAWEPTAARFPPASVIIRRADQPGKGSTVTLGPPLRHKRSQPMSTRSAGSAKPDPR
jgi:thiamine biosynthesis lipoprotein